MTFPLLKPKTLHTWFIHAKDVQDQLDKFTSILSADERARASRFHFAKDKNLFITARAVLRLLSGKYLKVPPEAIAFKYGEFGKPDFDFYTNLKFNISHSGSIASFSFVQDSDIGTDIEKLKYDFNVWDIVYNYFSDLEIETLRKMPQEKHVEGFYRCWTRKESFIKATAKGLSFPLNSFSVSINSNDKVKLLETKWDEDEKYNWNLFTFSPHTDYIGAISVKGIIDHVHYFEINPSMIFN